MWTSNVQVTTVAKLFCTSGIVLVVTLGRSVESASRVQLPRRRFIVTSSTSEHALATLEPQ